MELIYTVTCAMLVLTLTDKHYTSEMQITELWL